MVSARRNAETIRIPTLAVPHNAVEFVIVVRMRPRSVVVIRLSTVKQGARAGLLRNAEDDPPVPVHSAFDFEEVLRQRFEKFQMRRPSRSIVPDIRIVRTFLEVHSLHKLGDHRIHVRIPLAVRVRWQIQRHVIQKNSEIRPVIEIETTKKILVCLTAPGVLRDDHARNRLQNFSRP